MNIVNTIRLNYPRIFTLSILAFQALIYIACTAGNENNFLESPDRNLTLHFRVSEDSLVYYRVECRGARVIRDSRLGILRNDADFSGSLVLDSVSGPDIVKDNYDLVTGKKTPVNYVARQKIMHLHNRDGYLMDIVFRLSDDGLAFRYVFPGSSEEIVQAESEITEFNFQSSTRAYIQPMSVAKSGWCNTNPSYEEFYRIDIPLDSLPLHEPGWVMPALMKTGEKWVLISETGVLRNYCGSRLVNEPGQASLSIGFPPEAENFPGEAVKPRHTLPWETPWRILLIGDLGTIVESTLGTDLSPPTEYEDLSWIRPGRSSWSWVLLKEDSTVYSVQKRFIDYASAMGWEYCLIDFEWDVQIGYPAVEELSRYAAEKGVGLILWYNSSGDWNTTTYRPKSKLLTHEDRVREFSRLKEMGIKGIKVDFFGGDGFSVMEYYQDIFEDAAAFGLMVNCHGATLPRGWQRTYPNLVTMESIKGFEFVTFEQVNADNQPAHCCMIPYTRNVFDPMDFTPVCFSEVPRIQRLTSNAFELALSVMFWSGIQHYAETPQGMQTVPEYVRDFMKQVPNTWNDTRFIGGEPGRSVILARRAGDIWYLAGINGEEQEKPIQFSFEFLDAPGRAVLITDGEDARSFRMEELAIEPDLNLEINLKSRGGFVMRIRKLE